MQNFGLRLLYLRKLQELSITQAAFMLEVSPETYQILESLERPPDPDILKRAACAFSTSAIWLKSDCPAPPQDVPAHLRWKAERRIADKIRRHRIAGDKP